MEHFESLYVFISLEVRNELKQELCDKIKREINAAIKETFNTDMIKNVVPKNNSIQEIKTKTPTDNVLQTKHTLCVEPNEQESKFSEEKWNEVVKSTIEPKLKDIPVSKVLRSKNGKGIIFFPSEETRNQAVLNLENIYRLESEDKTPKKIYPKVKVGWIPKLYCEKSDKNTLKNTILTKNPAIRNLVENQNKTFEIIFTNDEKDNTYSYAVIKVDSMIKDEIKS